MNRSELIESWERRLQDARLFGYSVKAEMLIEEFLSDLRGYQRRRSSRMLTTREIKRAYFPEFDIQTIQRWARKGKWPGAKRTGDSPSHMWLIPEEEVVSELHDRN